MTPAAPRFLSAAGTDPGFVRENNEDRVYSDDVRGIYMVIDGMGGHNAGEQAADIALERIRTRLERQTGAAEQRVREAIALANNAIFEAARSNPEWSGMACVLTVAVIENGAAVIGHVGDSRLYKIRAGAIEKITHDHSPVGEREDGGELTEAEAMKHPRRNEVYRDVGSAEHAPDDEDFIEILNTPFEPDSALLLCSDGISDVLPAGEILKTVVENAGDRWSAVRRLIVAANAEGKDNVSAVLVEGENFAASYRRPSLKKRRNVVVTDQPAPETTGRLPAQAAPVLHAGAAWYATNLACLAYGLAVGALLAIAVQRFLPQSAPPRVPHSIVAGMQTGIAAALANAQAGDTVEVQPGIYPGDIRLREGIDLIAQRPRESVIQGSIVADGIRRARVSGFQVISSDVGIWANDSDIDIDRCEIVRAGVAGVRFSGNARGSLLGNSIHGNRGAGIAIDDSAAPAIENNVVAANGTEPGALRPGLLIRSRVMPAVAGNVFIGNGAEAIWLPAPDDRILQRNYFMAAGAKPDRKAPKNFRIVTPPPIQEQR